MANNQTVFNGDLHVNGALTTKNFTAPAGSIDDTAVKAGAGIQASKLQHQYVDTYAQDGNAASAAERRVIHVVRGGTGTIISIHVGVVTACIGDAVITIDLKKNGVSILTATITIDNASSAYSLKAGTVANAALVQGDALEIDVSVNAGTGALGNGVYAVSNVREDAQ